MLKITLKESGNDFWDRVAGLVNGEEGEVTGSPFTGGQQFHNAVFPAYGEVTWIPEEACTLSELAELS